RMPYGTWTFLTLSAALPTIVLFADHLTVSGDGHPASVPWGDVVSFHLFDLEVLLANRTDALLPFVGLALLAVGEGPQVEVLFVASEHERIDAAFLLDFIISHQRGDSEF